MRILSTLKIMYKSQPSSKPLERFFFTITLVLVFLLSACAEPATNNPGDPNNPTNPGSPNNPSTPASSVNLAWDKPAKNAEGASLSTSDILGYEISYRKEGEDKYVKLFVSGGDTETKTLTDLEKGRYEFRMATVMTGNVYSEYSESFFTDVVY